MKRFLFVITLSIIATSIFAQDKSAKEYKVEAAEAYKAKDYAKGLSSFEKAIQLYEADGKTDTTLYYNAAICALKQKEYDKSIGYFDRSVELGYKACKSNLYKATALKSLGKTDEMVALSEAGIEDCPKYKKKFNNNWGNN